MDLTFTLTATLRIVLALVAAAGRFGYSGRS
jgi:hypothetical protein